MGLWIGVVGGLVLVAAALYIELFFYEGVHLGERVQSRLYDRWAARYDRDKQASQAGDDVMLARPLLAALESAPAPLVLDVATGTGRLPLALLREPAFDGQVIALDISRGMLALAAERLAPFGARVTLVQYGATSLPFDADTFDVVCCMEALEVMPAVEPPLAEFARVLRPGGILLTSRGRESSGRIGQVHSPARFTALLNDAGFEQVEILAWWKTFDRVWARKPGESTLAGRRTLTDVLRCPSCGAKALAADPSRGLRCEQCRAEVSVSPERIVLYDRRLAA